MPDKVINRTTKPPGRCRTYEPVADELQTMEDAVLSGDEAAVARAAMRKYARVIDMTDSGRDIKPLVTGLFEAMDRLHGIEAQCGAVAGERPTPLAEVLELARAM